MDLEEYRKKREIELLNSERCKKCGELILRGSVMISNGYYHLECVRTDKEN